MEVSIIQKKLVRGFFSLTLRKVILDAISFVTIFVILAKYLPIQVIGVYGIAQSFLSFFSYFSDIGLGAALIQKKEITSDDLKTTFFIQELLISFIVLIIWFVAPIFVTYYNFSDAEMWLVRALGIAFFLSSLKVIPSNLLERELKFEPIVFVEIVETLFFNGLLIYLTFQNLGIMSFTVAVVVRGLVGALLINIIHPWGISFGFSKTSAKTLINFGIPFQLNSVLAMLKDRLTPLITAQIVGSVGFGYLTWAQGIAYRPLEIMSIVIRLTFPAYSRLQDKNEELKKIVEKSLFLTVTLIYPFLFGMLAVLPLFIEFMGKDKFAPALPLIYLFAFSTFWATPSTIFTNVLNAIGRVSITLKLMIMWTALTWIFSPILAIFYGYTGVAMASAIISLTSIVPIIIVMKIIKIDVLGNIWQPLVASLLMFGAIFLFSHFISVGLFNIILLISSGILLYLFLIFLIAKNKLVATLNEFRNVKV